MRVLLLVLVLLVGCCSGVDPEYVEADGAVWTFYDPFIDKWVDQEPSLTPGEKEALHLLNEGRRARVKHALEEIRAR